MRVRRAAVPVLLWCLATTASIAVASLALRPVLRTAVPADSVPAAATEDAGDRPAATRTLAPLPGPASTAPATPPRSSPPSGPGTPRGSASPAAGQRSSTAAPARTVDGWTVTTGADGVDVYLRSFRTGGGDAVIRIRAGVVSVVTATPRDGYSVSQSQSDPSRLAVQFVPADGGVAYLVDCMWWQNGPHGEVTTIGG